MTTGDADDTRSAEDLEQLWAGAFGTAWTERNNEPSPARARFWTDIVRELEPRSVLEVGCGHGMNLRQIAAHVDARHLWGTDINVTALDAAARAVPGGGFGWAPARELPFRDQQFDLVFTVGVLIHQPDATLPLVVSELVRTSRRWILCGEYHADDAHTIDYRGERGALFKRDYTAFISERFPTLRHVRTFEANEEYGFDRTTIAIFER